MLKNYRWLIIAAIGWLVAANNDQVKQYHARSERRDVARVVAPPTLRMSVNSYKLDCEHPADVNEASSCASISQARSAEAANFLSANSLLWNKVGIAVVILTLGFTAWAAIAAAKAATIGEKALRDVQRAFVYADALEEHVMTNFAENVVGWQIFVPWRNTGSTPAINCIAKTNLLYLGGGRRSDAPVAYEGKLPLWWPFMDADVVESNNFVIGPQAIMKAGPIPVSIDILNNVFTKTGFLFIYGWITFDDIFGKPHETRFCVELANLSSDPLNAFRMPDRLYNHWLRFNTSDEQCAQEDAEMFSSMPDDVRKKFIQLGWKPKGVKI